MCVLQSLARVATGYVLAVPMERLCGRRRKGAINVAYFQRRIVECLTKQQQRDEEEANVRHEYATVALLEENKIKKIN